MQLFRIIEGWKNYLTKSDEVETLAKQRALNCVNCEFKKESTVFSWVVDDVKEINASVCSKCDCPIAMKVRSIKDKCPIGKW